MVMPKSFKYIVIGLIAILMIGTSAFSTSLLIPMDDAQTDHLKAYGVMYRALENNASGYWLLNYRGGSFLIEQVPPGPVTATVTASGFKAMEVPLRVTATPPTTLSAQLEELHRAAQQLNLKLRRPFMALSFLNLSVIGSLKLTDQGLIDVDNFKSYNDNYGHDVGDAVLRGFGGVVRDAIRTTDTLFRWGGEEFVGLIRNINAKDLEHLAGYLLVELVPGGEQYCAGTAPKGNGRRLRRVAPEAARLVVAGRDHAPAVRRAAAA